MRSRPLSLPARGVFATNLGRSFTAREFELHFRQGAIGKGKVRIALSGLFEQFHCPIAGLFLRPPNRPVDVAVLRLSIISIGHRIGGRLFRDRGLFRRREPGPKLIGDPLRDLSLDREYVCDIAVVMFSPEMRIVARVDQLRVHPNLPASALDTAFYHMRNTQSFCDLTQVAFQPLCISSRSFG